MTHGFSAKGRLQLRPLVEPHRAVIDGGDDLRKRTGIVTDPNNPALAYSQNSPGQRYFAAINYTASYFNWGATTFSVFYDGHTNGNTSYVFASDANGDGFNATI